MVVLNGYRFSMSRLIGVMFSLVIIVLLVLCWLSRVLCILGCSVFM